MFLLLFGRAPQEIFSTEPVRGPSFPPGTSLFSLYVRRTTAFPFFPRHWAFSPELSTLTDESTLPFFFQLLKIFLLSADVPAPVLIEEMTRFFCHSRRRFFFDRPPLIDEDSKKWANNPSLLSQYAERTPSAGSSIRLGFIRPNDGFQSSSHTFSRSMGL